MSDQTPLSSPKNSFDDLQQKFQQTSTWAIVSLVATLSFFFLPVVGFVGPIVGIVTGNMAKKEIKESGGVLKGENLAKIGIIVGWILIGLEIVGLICAVLSTIFGFALPLVSMCLRFTPRRIFTPRLPTPTPSSMLWWLLSFIDIEQIGNLIIDLEQMVSLFK